MAPLPVTKPNTAAEWNSPSHPQPCVAVGPRQLPECPCVSPRWHPGLVPDHSRGEAIPPLPRTAAAGRKARLGDGAAEWHFTWDQFLSRTALRAPAAQQQHMVSQTAAPWDEEAHFCSMFYYRGTRTLVDTLLHPEYFSLFFPVGSLMEAEACLQHGGN